MVFPATSSFPAAAGGFPASPASSDPSFGANPFGFSTSAFGQTLQQDAQSILEQRSRQQAALMQAAQFAATNGALDGALDTTNSVPTTWTPEQAAQQNDRALAKLATVNPELAQQLADQRSGAQTGGGGIFGALKHIAGAVLGAGVSVGGKLLDIVSRPAHIIPNLAYDMADGGSFHWNDDIGGALSGTMTHNWNGVLQKMGWNGGGLEGTVRALVGFGGDVLTDPVTYLYPVGAGVKLSEAMGQAGRKVATESPGMLNLARTVDRFAGQTDQTITDALHSRWDLFMNSYGRREMAQFGKENGLGDLLDRFQVMTVGQYGANEMNLYRTMFETGWKTGSLVRSRTLKSAVREGLVLSDGVVSAPDVRTLLEKAVSDGNWTKFGSSQWREGRAFAAIAGGARFKVSVPFTDFRYIGPSFLYGRLSRYMPQNALQTVGRFFAGQSGMQNLVHLIGLGNATFDHLQYWMEHGWDDFSKTYPNIVDQLRGSGKNLGSMMYSASEKLGRATAWFDASAKLDRAGLAGWMGRRGAVEAHNAANVFVRDAERRALGVHPNLQGEFEKAFGTASQWSVETQADMQRFMDYFPEHVDTSSPEHIDAWFRTTHPEYTTLDNEAAAGALSGGDEQAYAQMTAQLDDMKAVAERMTPARRNALNKLQAVQSVVMDEATKWGVPIGNVKFHFDEAVGIHPNQSALWRSQVGANHPLVNTPEGGVFYIHANDLNATGMGELPHLPVGERQMIPHTDGHGVRVYSKPTSSFDRPVYIRGREFVAADENGQGLLPREGKSPEWTLNDERREIDQAVTDLEAKVQTVLAQQTGGPADFVRTLRDASPVYDAAERQAKTSRMFAEAVQSYRENAAGVLRQMPDGSVEVSVFDPKNVKLAGVGGQDFKPLAEYQGYAHRTLSRKASQWIGGVVNPRDPQPLLSVPQLKASIQRETIGMTFQEANDHIRRKVVGLAEVMQRQDPARVRMLLKDLPDTVLETNILDAHKVYMNQMAQGVRAVIMGRVADSEVQLGRLAPFMFSRAPRESEYEWFIDPKKLKMLAGKDKALIDNVLTLRKKGMRFMEAHQKYQQSVAEDYGNFSLMVDDALTRHMPPPDREVEALGRWNTRKADAYGILDKREQLLNDRLGALANDDTHYQQAQRLYVEHFQDQMKVPEPGTGTPVWNGQVIPTEEPFKNPVHIKLKHGKRMQRVHVLGEQRDILTEEPGIVVKFLARGTSKKYFWPYSKIEDVRFTPRNLAMEPDEALKAKFDREVEAGNIHARWHAEQDKPVVTEVFSREGNLVKKGGGHEVRPADEIAVEREQLQRELDRVAVYRKALDGAHPLDVTSVETWPPPEGMFPSGAKVAADAEAGFHVVSKYGRTLQGEGLPADGGFFPTQEQAQAYLDAHSFQPKPGTYRGQQATEFALRSRRVAARAHTKAQRVAAEAATVLERSRADMTSAMTEVNKAYAEAKGIVSDMKPALHHYPDIGGLTGLTRLKGPGLDGYAMPAYIAEEWHRMLDIHGPEGLRKGWRQFVMGPWKRWATYRWPGFHVRNSYGAWFNNWLSGVVGHQEYGFSYRTLHHRFVGTAVSDDEFARYNLGSLFGAKAKGKVTYGDVRNHLARSGVAGAGTQQVMETWAGTEWLKDASTAMRHQDVGAVRKTFRVYDDKMRDVGASVENYFRAGAWAGGMAATGGDTYAARAFVMMRQGDYADLTPYEDAIRDVVPFYKWMRTNVPYQFRMLAEAPGPMTLVADKVKNLAYGVAGYDRTQAELQMPDWMKQDLSLPIPKWVPVFGSKGPDAIKYAMFNMPFSDLFNGLNDYMSSALPVVRNLLESYGTHSTWFTGAPLTGRMKKLSGVWSLPGISNLLEMAHIAHKGADGGLYIKDTTENVLMGWPIYSRVRNFVEADPARVEQRLGAVFSTMAGVGVREADFNQAELDFYNNTLAPTLQTYRDMGVSFPSAQDFAAGASGVAPALPGFTMPDVITG